MLTATELSASYKKPGGLGHVQVLNNISLSVAAGEYCSIVGPSGCGKTTLLLALAGLLQADAFTGSVLWDQRPPELVRQEHKIGFVFQRSPFLEWLTVRQNVSLTLRVAGMLDVGLGKDAEDHILEFFGLAGYGGAYPHQLSGGMLSRLALARALVHRPKYLILDEAFNHLDELTRNSINTDLEQMRRKLQATAIAVTHNLEEAVFMSDSVVVLSNKPTRVTEVIRVPFARPRSSDLRSSLDFASVLARVRAALGDRRGGEQT